MVDDDVLERMGASFMFTDAGYQVLEAGSADAALRFSRQTRNGLLFTDVSMPGTINGADLARQVAERWPRVGIIMTSGRPFPDDFPGGCAFIPSRIIPSTCSGTQGKWRFRSGDPLLVSSCAAFFGAPPHVDNR